MDSFSLPFIKCIPTKTKRNLFFFWSELSVFFRKCNSRFPLQFPLKSAGFPLLSGLIFSWFAYLLICLFVYSGNSFIWGICENLYNLWQKNYPTTVIAANVLCFVNLNLFQILLCLLLLKFFCVFCGKKNLFNSIHSNIHSTIHFYKSNNSLVR